MRTSDPSRGAAEPTHGAAAGMFATKSAAHAPTAESSAQATAPESAAAFITAATATESSASSMTTTTTESSAASVTAAAATESSASSMTTTTTTTADSPGHGVSCHCCTECDGDEEDHDLACDWLLLDAGR
jgi:hypothetical protein